jgi:hypothetical protein
MSLILIVPEDGSLDSQELQYMKIKKGDNVQLSLQFYKDIFHIYPWNLASPVQFNLRAKKLKELTTYVFSKDKASTDIDLASAATGLIKTVLNSTDTAGIITGDVATFTGIAGDKIKVTIDDIVYDDINISAAVSIDTVVTAINTAVGSVVASKAATTGFLKITSPTTGDSSNVTIANGTNTTQTVVGDLFATAARTASGHYGDLSIAQSLYVEVEFQPNASSRIYKTVDILIDVVDSLV